MFKWLWKIIVYWWNTGGTFIKVKNKNGILIIICIIFFLKVYQIIEEKVNKRFNSWRGDKIYQSL